MRIGTVVILQRAAAFRSGALDETDRTHLDLHTDSAAEQAAEIERLIGLGARRVDWTYQEGATHVVLADPDGNLFCVVNTGRDDPPRPPA
jgi:catechol 2,3-dioxygenase-like lactoylglutathione lyase family enzyme